MKRLTLVTAAVTALALASVPAFADNNKSKGKAEGQSKQTAVEVNGTVTVAATLVDTNTITVLVKAASQPKALKALTKTLKDASITVKADTNTVVKRSGNTVKIGALLVGDKVNVRAACKAGAPVVCVATRITAVPAPAPKPTPQHVNLTLTGVVVNASGVPGVMGVVVTKAEAGDDNTFKAKSVLGTTVTLAIDSSTVVSKAGVAANLVNGGSPASLAGNPAVTVQAICPAGTLASCIAKRITVIVPSV